MTTHEPVTQNASFYSPAPDVRIGIEGGPILRSGIRDELPHLVPEQGRYIALVSLLAPSSQKIAAAVFWAEADEIVKVVDVVRGPLRRGADGTAVPDTAGPDITQLRSALAATHGIRLPGIVDTRATVVTGGENAVSNDVYALPWRIATQLAPPSSILHAAAEESTQETADRVARERRIFTDLHAGVYRAGFLSDQAQYDAQVDATVRYLADLDALLRERPYLSGERPGLDDLWAFTLIVRFDHVYGPLFRLHRTRITDHPALLDWARRLYQDPILRGTTDFDAITQGYYVGIASLRRSVVPQGVRDRHLIADTGRR